MGVVLRAAATRLKEQNRVYRLLLMLMPILHFHHQRRLSFLGFETWIEQTIVLTCHRQLGSYFDLIGASLIAGIFSA